MLHTRRMPKWFFRLILLAIIALFLLGQPLLVLAQSSYDLVIHNILAVPLQGQAAFDVSVFFSVLDEDGNPVNDLDTDDFSAMEDSKSVEIVSLDLVRDQPNHVVLVIDASGSMVGDNMTSAKDAAGEFVQALERDDRVAVISFTRETITEINFTENREDARNAIDGIEAVRNSDTCLYDAVYDAVQMLAPQPQGRRAVIVLTDGVDETLNGGNCSVHTLDDVTDLAITGGTRTPIYTIGLTDRSDERNLERMSVLTGGRYRLAPDRSYLEDRFDALTDQFRNEYVLHYTSTSAPGTYQLLLEVDHRDRRDQDTRNFVLPDLAVDVFINSPAEGAALSGISTIEASATGQNQVRDVVFYINDSEVGAANTAPYQLAYDFDLLSPGDYTIRVVARDFNNNELASSSIAVSVVASQEAAAQATEVKPTDIPLPTAAPASSGLDMPRNTLLLIGLGVLALLAVVVAVAIIFVIISRRKKQEEEESFIPSQPADDRTVDVFPRHEPMRRLGGQPAAGPLAVLRVLASEDSMMVGKVINLTRQCTTIGRGADNDIVLPSDKAVSRQHVMIELTGTEFFLSEFVTQDPGGAVKRPTYGTFVNDQKVGTLPVQLKSGDEVQLGTRFKFQFEKLESAIKSTHDSERTLDNLDDEDKTLIM